mmetsp:Transcript_121565/g.223950  ORF Transcript_121565/g.223950 Transcript_121565/m.223950 type:complete len:202 (-) Transcript_121565:1739-2344(-)
MCRRGRCSRRAMVANHASRSMDTQMVLHSWSSHLKLGTSLQCRSTPEIEIVVPHLLTLTSAGSSRQALNPGRHAMDEVPQRKQTTAASSSAHATAAMVVIPCSIQTPRPKSWSTRTQHWSPELVQTDKVLQMQLLASLLRQHWASPPKSLSTRRSPTQSFHRAVRSPQRQTALRSHTSTAWRRPMELAREETRQLARRSLM